VCNTVKCVHPFFNNKSTRTTEVRATPKLSANGSPTYMYIYTYNWYQRLTKLYVQLQRVRIRYITFPSPLFIHYPQCIIYICTYKISKIFKNMWILYVHSILALPSCILRTVPSPLDLYQLHGLILELFDSPIQYANQSHLEIAFWLHLNHILINNMISIRYIPFKK
jgi:hypothetical protein